MNAKSKAGALILLLVASIAAPYITFAAHSSIQENVFNISILQGPLLLCVGSPSPSGTGTTPTCANLCDFIAEVAQIIYFGIAVVIWIVTPILIAFSGIYYMLAGANSEMIGRAKKTITGTVWGIAIVLCAWIIVSIFISAIGINGVSVTNVAVACM